MQSNDEVVTLLTDIRDSQQKLLTEYSRVANEALSLQREGFASQQKAVETQQNHVRLYRRMLLVFGLVMAFLIWRLLSLGI